MKDAGGGGGGGGGDLDTKLDGSPGSIRAVGDWLRRDFGEGAEDIADTAHRQKTRTESHWTGEAGTAFAGRVKELAKAGDGAKSTASKVATDVDQIASDLERAQNDLAAVRSTASGEGLTVAGTIVKNPGAGPDSPGDLPAGADEAQTAAWNKANDRVKAHNLLVEAFNRAVKRAEEIFKGWYDALEKAPGIWEKHHKNLVGLTAPLLASNFEISLVARAYPALAGQIDFLNEQVARNLEHADAMSRDGVVNDRSRYYQILDEIDDLKTNQIPEATKAVKNIEVPKGVTRGLWALDVLATGYAIKVDMDNGESTAQAVTSNGVSMVASIAAGAYIGGAIGTAIPVPVLGTAVGVVAGAAVGTVVGAFTSGVIDSVWEEGMTSLGDAGKAVEKGWDEIKDTGAAIGDLAEGAWDAVF